MSCQDLLIINILGYGYDQNFYCNALEIFIDKKFIKALFHTLFLMEKFSYKILRQ